MNPDYYSDYLKERRIRVDLASENKDLKAQVEKLTAQRDALLDVIAAR